jgi:YXWGXW repeat-containing protein
MSRISAIDPAFLRSNARKLFLILAVALFILIVRSVPVHAQGVQLDASVALPGVEVSFTANDPPPPLPVYEQPVIPGDGYLWMPGYWSWNDEGYFWVPGTWVEPPQAGLLWTPGYWGFDGGVYGFRQGYWGASVGFYGGVNYGFGYGGVGFAGGRWDGGHFAYNTAVTHVDTTIIHNTYNQTVINNNTTVTRVSFNGGTGGVVATPTPAERAAAQQRHVAPTAAQTSHVQEAGRNPSLFAKANGGHPAIAATARPGVFSGPGVVAAHEAGRAAPATGAPKTNPASTARPTPAASPRPMTPKPAPPKPAPAKPMPVNPAPARPEAARPETERPVTQERPVEERPTLERAEPPKPPTPEASRAAPKPTPKPEPRPKEEEK